MSTDATPVVLDQVRISGDNLSPAIDICTVIFIVPAALAVAGRIFTKLAVVKKFNLDDHLILSAFVVSLAQTATVVVSIGNGVGQHWENLRDLQHDRYQKSLYASNILLILSLILTKLSVSFFIQSLSPHPSYLKVGNGFSIGLIVSCVIFVFAAAFQCFPPMVWNQQGKCYDIAAFWISFDIFNIVTDFVLIVWPAVFIIKLQTNSWRKGVIIMIFSTRVFAIGASIAQIVYQHRAKGSTDRTFDTWPLVISTQAMQCLSLVTACIPQLRPFLESMESGLMRSDDFRRRGMTWKYGYGQSKMSEGVFSTGKSNKKSISSIKKGSHNDNLSDEIRLRPIEDATHFANVHADGHEWGHESISSRAKITVSKQWSVGEQKTSA